MNMKANPQLEQSVQEEQIREALNAHWPTVARNQQRSSEVTSIDKRSEIRSNAIAKVILGRLALCLPGEVYSGHRDRQRQCAPS